MTRAHRLMLAVAETDRECRLDTLHGKRVWLCRCIHCRRHLVLPVEGGVPGSATLEHIVPRTHGGNDELENLALACAACNHGKGTRLDHRKLSDPTLQEVIANLQARRRANFRVRE